MHPATKQARSAFGYQATHMLRVRIHTSLADPITRLIHLDLNKLSGSIEAIRFNVITRVALRPSARGDKGH